MCKRGMSFPAGCPLHTTAGWRREEGGVSSSTAFTTLHTRGARQPIIAAGLDLTLRPEETSMIKVPVYIRLLLLVIFINVLQYDDR